MAIKSKIKGKKPKKNKPTSQKWKKYTIENGKIKREKTCPRCGPGIFMANNNGKSYCGKCHYTEFAKKETAVEKPTTE